MTKQSPVEFFTANAGTITNADGTPFPYAEQLAIAEYKALTGNITFEWMPDNDDYPDNLGDHEYWCERAEQGKAHRHRVEGCVMYGDRGEVLGSLWGIIDADQNYRRVIQAELASEL